MAGVLLLPLNQSAAASDETGKGPVDFNSPHRMTGVDKVHEAGIYGKGVRIAIIDTGVDYLHPALGGCFGPGCKFAFGYDLVGDDYGDTRVPAPKPDPLATCFDGFHRTHVTGIVGMEVPSNSSFFPGLVSVAPEATIGMYRVFGCEGSANDDIIVAAMQRAADDGADLISMSIGEYGSYGDGAFTIIPAAVAAIQKRGVAVIAAAGNYGSFQSFATELPGNADGALAIASAENAEFPTYPVRDSNGEEFRYGALFPFPEGNYSVAWTNDNANSTHGCSPSDYPPASDLETDISEYIIVVRRGLCSLTQLQSAAAAANFSLALSYPDSSLDNIFIENYGLPSPAKTADESIYAFGSTTGDTLEKAARAGQPYTLTVGPPRAELVPQIGGGKPNNFSSVGPTSDFKLKPQLMAPGGLILSTWPLTDKSPGYGIISGTSMSTPYVAGVYALIKSKYPDLTPPEIYARIQTTADQVAMANFPGVAPAPQQGAGLVRAHRAILQASSIGADGRELNLPYDGEAATRNFTIRNPSSAAVTYKLSNLPANGMAYWPEGSSRPNGEGFQVTRFVHLTPLPFSAKVNFMDGDEVTVEAGGPVPLDIPVYSGYLQAVSSQTEEKLSIPYVGPAYNYGASPAPGTKPLTDEDRKDAWNAARDILGAPQAYVASDKSDMGDYRVFSLNGTDYPVAYFSTTQMCQWWRMDLVPASTNFTPTYYGYDPAVRFDNLTEPDMPVNVVFGGVPILGYLYQSNPVLPNFLINSPWVQPADYATNTLIPLSRGSYRILLRWLKFGRDVDKVTDWES
ncbi:peptidase S8/S53 domain-containing protein [Apiospora hydei]|uniref:Peptidase S8/S53 domain-containing protein n=1 Tax=Apiospora hydei TaxID=1337664 RepID=A0ABR1X359_9PEZI